MVRLRPATPDDASPIAAVHVATWRDAYADILPREMLVGLSASCHTERWLKTLRQRRRRENITVAVADNTVVGFATAGPARRHWGTDAGEVTMLYVLGDYQERGLGRALLRDSFDALRRHGMTRALVWVVAQNPARFFYEAMGGTARHNRREHLWGTTVATVGYAWDDLDAAVRALDATMARAANGPGHLPPDARP
ncbi:MAG: GNAT family N-acetyltransferase [Alphaproteobacteria bacterium]